MIGRIYKYALILTGLLVSCYVNAQTTGATKNNKEVTEVIINGQQNASDWFRAESPHFIIYSDTSTENVSALINKLERLNYLLHLYTSNEINESSNPKLKFYYLKNFSDLRQFESPRPDYAIGLFNSCALGIQGFATHMFYSEKNNSLLEKQPENEGLAYIFEAYARHFIYHNSSLRTPTWYIDGFAQYFAGTRFSEKETLVGMAPASIGEYLGSMHSTGRYNSLDYKDILLQNDSNSRNLAGTAGVKLEFQARSWILTHYILSSSENIQHFRKYVSLITQDTEPTKAFEQAFGFKVSQLSKVLWRYKWQSAEALKTNLMAGGTTDISFNSLPKAANNLVLADAAINSCPNSESGAILLEKIRKEAKKNPDSDYAKMVLNRAEVNFGNAQDALANLTEQTLKNNSNYDAFYLLGLAQLRLAVTTSGHSDKTLLNSAQHNLLKAVTLNPQAPEALYAYFKAGVAAQENPSEQVLGAAVLAWKLAREVNTYSKSAVLTYAYLGRNIEAQDALALLLHNSRDPLMMEWAKTWQARLNTGMNKTELLHEMRLAPIAEPSFKEWTIATAEVMKAVSLAAGMQAAQNVILDQRMQGQQTQNQGLNSGAVNTGQ